MPRFCGVIPGIIEGHRGVTQGKGSLNSLCILTLSYPPNTLESVRRGFESLRLRHSQIVAFVADMWCASGAYLSRVPSYRRRTEARRFEGLAMYIAKRGSRYWFR